MRSFSWHFSSYTWVVRTAYLLLQLAHDASELLESHAVLHCHFFLPLGHALRLFAGFLVFLLRPFDYLLLPCAQSLHLAVARGQALLQTGDSRLHRLFRALCQQTLGSGLGRGQTVLEVEAVRH